MNTEELNQILAGHKLWLDDILNGQRADLSHADLSGADLSGADLCRADLSGANLSGAVLCGADLRRADLSGAVLCGADLSGADLRRAVLSGADLSGAVLWSTTGDGKYIRSMQLPVYNVAVVGEVVQIGCQQHTIEEWAKFSVLRIAKMDEQAIGWWHTYKELVLSFARAGK